MTITPALSVRSLGVNFGSNQVVKNLSFDVYPGKTTAIVGESGSGKSVTSLAIMRLVEYMNAEITSGSILFNRDANGSQPLDLTQLSDKAMRKIRGKEIAMIFQEPMTSLNPVYTIGDQITEVLVLHEKLTQDAARVEAVKLLKLVRLADAEALLKRYPHQLSGGMRQRVMIAMALACRPKVLVADEPTTALDVTIQAQILTIMRDLQQELGMAVIFITHDMGVVAEMADQVVVMRHGEKVEEGAVEEIFARPQHPYTQALLAAVPKLGSMQGEALPRMDPLVVLDGNVARTLGESRQQDTARIDEAPVVEIENLVTRFDIRKGFFGGVSHRVHAVENVSFSIFPGETLALVGESGSGKSTIGRTIQQLQESTSGTIRFGGKAVADMSRAEKMRLRQEVQYIFQDPFASLDPRKTVGFSIAEPIRTHGLLHGAKAIRHRVNQLLERVGLSADQAERYPHEFSGGQRQRVCIARALASKPKLIIADEALSALDVSIQAQIIHLLMELQQDEGLAYLFISHDMAVVEKMSHRVAVLHLGQVVELGERRAVFDSPQHSYTRKLLSAVPVADPAQRRERTLLQGDILSPIRKVGDEPEHWSLVQVASGHFVAQEVGSAERLAS
ncbi:MULTISPECIES: ABC transporter ATP-binding protein [Halomonadaceae]|uniref:ABC transporter ATP-binding protein n=1 Tax=Halomonadaceae TaxID=28256 RepID=UPI0012F33596|nr:MULTISPECIES: ABC transporter ATP-binding protein [Halomonas]UEQ04539.1 ABC transporter ATP-binding protein [Halomonas profundus]CAD5248139.1 putative peptide transport fused subunits of ABC superfamily: ATP-binding components [Halomonas sp. I3]CAD5269424.1 putative peptide transport fused subunits of ABC superfamily: ATP-binding components [Halomonas sp. 113]CAD5271313.1 putative peptide transport fused subunits of ABC superfamily: ATP-binding components [Halomonas sp. 59]CAD5282212.1 puta